MLSSTPIFDSLEKERNICIETESKKAQALLEAPVLFSKNRPAEVEVRNGRVRK